MKLIYVLFLSFLPLWVCTQNAILEGYVYEDNNRGYLNEVKITVLEEPAKTVVAEITSNIDGFFTCWAPVGKHYTLRAEKDVFFTKEIPFSTAGKAEGEKIFVNVQMERQPGYLLELTLAEEGSGPGQTVAVTGARIEVFNHTTDSLELGIPEHPSSFFSHTLRQGNHYTILIRKQEYFNKRIEAYVNIEGCIVCIDGVSDLTPGVTDNLTEGHQMGALLANLEMERAKLNKTIQVENIYYEYNQWELNDAAIEELNKIIVFLKENPSLLAELGSHTDSRGYERYNRELSQKRAQAAVDYITQVGGIELERIAAKGYGESQLRNKCADGVTCTEEEHARNRRTELKVIGFSSYNPYNKLSLREIVYREREEQLLREIQSGETIQVKAGEELPEDLKKQLEKQKNR